MTLLQAVVGTDDVKNIRLAITSILLGAVVVLTMAISYMFGLDTGRDQGYIERCTEMMPEETAEMRAQGIEGNYYCSLPQR